MNEGLKKKSKEFKYKQRRKKTMNIEEQAREDVRNYKYHNLVPGQKSPQEFEQTQAFWNYIYSDYAPELNTGLKMRQYKEAWLAEYQKQWDAYFGLGGD